MKRLFTLAALFAMALAVSAQGYRKWDFTQWSATTVANLTAEATTGGVTGGTWSDTEKANGDNPQTGNCFWSYGNNVIDGELSANGSVISETAGLVFNTAYTTRRSLAIAVSYPSTSLGEYAGPQYLWLGGGNAKSASARIYCFIIPKVHVGQKITMTVESHKPSDARGVALYAGDCTNDELIIGESFTPKTQETHTWEEGWTLPEGATANDDGTIDIQVYNTNGCHIYSIEVGTADQKSKVGYLYGGSLDADLAYQQLKDNEKYAIEAVEASGALAFDQLTQYDAIVISSTVENAEAIASLKTIQPFVPTLNLNASLYTAWGYGTAMAYSGQFADVKQPGNTLFQGLELIQEDEVNGLKITDADYFLTLSLEPTALFGNDPVLATAMGTDDVAIHAHNLAHNGYIYLPLDQTGMGNGGNAALLANAIAVVAGSKAKVTQAPMPVITLEYKNLSTVVSIKSGVVGAEIFYTIDGSEPTEQSLRYTEPFTIDSEGVTVKAAVRGDGYLLSEVAEKTVDLKKQAPSPTIAQQQANGETTVTITSDVEGAAIFYNYSGLNDTLKSSRYTAPVIVKKARTLYAFVVAEGFVNSEVASQEIDVQNPKLRLDIIAHMDANKDEYYEKSDKSKSTTGYFFSWGKNKATYPFWNTEEGVEEKVVTDPETGDESVVMSYTVMNPEEEVDFGNGWMIRSRGQIVIWEGLTATDNVGDTGGRNPATVDDMNPDFPITNYFVNLGEKNTMPADASFPYNAYIISTNKFQGPFDIVANIGNGAGAESKQDIVLQVSTDGNAWESNWQTLGDTIKVVNGQRLYRNVTRSYEGTDEVYVRAYLADNNSKAQFYDIYIANAGEKTQEYLSGISNQQVAAKRISTVYGLNGARHTTLRRGLNIVRYSDGTTRKVIVK